MKRAQSRFLVGLALAVAIGGYFLLCYLRLPQPSFEEAVTVVRAVEAFAQTRAQTGQPRPASVQMSDLVTAGLITQRTAQRFAGSEIVLTQEPDETRPQTGLVQLRLRDGRLIMLLADGSAQQVAGQTPAPK